MVCIVVVLWHLGDLSGVLAGKFLREILLSRRLISVACHSIPPNTPYQYMRLLLNFPLVWGCWGVYNYEQQRLGVRNGAISYCRHHLLVCMVIPFTFKTPDLRSSSFYPPKHHILTYESAPELSTGMGYLRVYNDGWQRVGD